MADKDFAQRLDELRDTLNQQKLRILRELLDGEMTQPPKWADEVLIVAYWQDSEGITRAFCTRKDCLESVDEIRQISAHAGSTKFKVNTAG